MNEMIGWLGSFLLSTCGIPLIIRTYKIKSSKELSIPFLLWWFFGEVFFLIYIIPKNENLLPLILNYGFNIMCIISLFTLIMIYKRNG